MSGVNLETKLCGLTLKNPLIAASGTFGYGKEFSPYLNLNEIGGMCSKGLTLNPREGKTITVDAMHCRRDTCKK